MIILTIRIYNLFYFIVIVYIKIIILLYIIFNHLVFDYYFQAWICFIYYLFII